MARTKQTARPVSKLQMIQNKQNEAKKSVANDVISKLKQGIQIMRSNVESYEKDFMLDMMVEVCNTCESVISAFPSEIVERPTPTAITVQKVNDAKVDIDLEFTAEIYSSDETDDEISGNESTTKEKRKKKERVSREKSPIDDLDIDSKKRPHKSPPRQGESDRKISDVRYYDDNNERLRKERKRDSVNTPQGQFWLMKVVSS